MSVVWGSFEQITQRIFNEPILVKKITAPLVIAHTAHTNTHHISEKNFKKNMNRMSKYEKWSLFFALKEYSLGYQIAAHI